MIEYSCIASSSAGNCHYININGIEILIDVGMSTRYIVNTLKSIGKDIENIKHVIISHAHSDHIKGLKVLQKKYDFKIHMHKTSYEYVYDYIIKDRVLLFEDRVIIEDLNIKAVEVPHDFDKTFGFVIKNNKKTISVITDLGYIDERIMSEIKKTNFLVIEANHEEDMVHTGPYPYALKRRILGEGGHISNTVAANIIKDIYNGGNLDIAILAHLSSTNNYPELAIMSVEGILKKNGIINGKDIIIDITYKDRATPIYRMGE